MSLCSGNRKRGVRTRPEPNPPGSRSRRLPPSSGAVCRPAAPAAPAIPSPRSTRQTLPRPRPPSRRWKTFSTRFGDTTPAACGRSRLFCRHPAPGVSRVLVLVKAANPGPKDQTAQLSFFTLPDGKLLVADSLLPFGSKPFQNYREILQAGATGPSKGGASKAMEFVEFSDFECPHCKDAQPIVAKLLADYPSAHFVYQDFPLTQIHTEALKASTHGYCVAKAGGNDAFFKFSDALFDAQAGLTPATSDETLKDAETKAGQDPAKIAACSTTPAAKEAIDASRALGERVGREPNAYNFCQWPRPAPHRNSLRDAAEDHRVPGQTGRRASARPRPPAPPCETGSIAAIACSGD